MWEFGEYNGGQGGWIDRLQGLFGCRRERPGSKERRSETSEYPSEIALTDRLIRTSLGYRGCHRISFDCQLSLFRGASGFPLYDYKVRGRKTGPSVVSTHSWNCMAATTIISEWALITLMTTDL